MHGVCAPGAGVTVQLRVLWEKEGCVEQSRDRLAVQNAHARPRPLCKLSKPLPPYRF
jgi:hypothetical protein